MNNLIKYNNLIILISILIKETKDFNLIYNNKLIKFTNNECYLINLSLINKTNQNIKINCFLNKKKIITLESNNNICIIHQILNIKKNDILTFKNASKNSLDINNISLKIFKL